MLPQESLLLSKGFICRCCTLSRAFQLQARAQSTRHPTSPTTLRQQLRLSTQARRVYSSQAQYQQQQQNRKKEKRYRAAKLTNRRLISVHGRDAPGFLQGITTNTIRPNETRGIFSAFLTAQGRVLNDVFIYPSHASPAYLKTLPGTVSAEDPGYLIEVHAAEASKLATYIRRFKLRAKVNVKLLDEGEWNVWSIWHSSPSSSSSHSLPASPITSLHDLEFFVPSEIGCLDRRAPGMGQRAILPGDESPVLNQPNDPNLDRPEIEHVSLKAYTVRRMLHGVAEGQYEIWRETALPQESNIDYMGGIDYRKGCYVGQELTIRTHHTGVVRKRILPCRVYARDEEEPEGLLDGLDDEDGIGDENGDRSGDGVDGHIPPGTDITLLPSSRDPSSSPSTTRSRKTGKWLQGIDKVGLALCRLDVMTDTKLPAGSLLWKPGMQFGCSWMAAEGEMGTGNAMEKREVRVKAFVPAWFPKQV